MIKRYNIVEHSYGDGDISMDVREDLEGQYVEYEDIKHLLQNTSSNSDYAKCPCCGEPWDIRRIRACKCGAVVQCKHFA